MAIFVAITIVLGLIFLTIPNVEMVTASIFLAGYLLGSKKGAIVGVVAEFLYSVLNPYGIAAPPLLIAQIISMSIVGYFGGIAYILTSKTKKQLITSIQFGTFGFILTLLFDFLTTISFAIFMADTQKKIFASIISSIIYGLPFYITHILANTLIFAIIVPLLIRSLTKIDYFKSKFIIPIIIFSCFIPLKLNAAYKINRPSKIAAHGRLTNSAEKYFLTTDDSSKVISSDSTLVDTISVIADSTIDTTHVFKELPLKINILENDTSRASQQWKSTRIISKSQIQHLIYNNPGEILTYLPGFYTKNHSYPGQFLTTTRHGIPSNNLTILLDGRPMKDPHTNLCDLNLIPAEYIDSISAENASSTLDFNNSINFITERYSDNRPYSKVYFHKGPSKFSDVDVSFGQQISNKIDGLFGLTLKGFSDPLEANSYEHYIFRAKFHHRYSPRWRLIYTVLNNRIKLHPIGPKGSNGNYATPEAHSKQIRFDHTLTVKGNVLNSYYQNLLIKIYYSSIFKDYNDPSYSMFSKDRYRYVGAITELRHQIGSHYLLAAATIEHDWTNADDVGEKNQSFCSLSFQDDWFWNEKSGLKGKIFVNGQTELGMNLNSGLSAFFQLTHYFKTSISINHAVRYPTLFELYVNDYLYGNSMLNLVKPLIHYPVKFDVHTTGYLRGNSDLKPEKIQQANIEFHFQPANSFNINTIFYLRHVTNYIDYGTYTDSSTMLINLDNQNYYGIDVQFYCKLYKGFNIGTNFNFVDVEHNILYEAPSSTIYSYIEYKNVFFKDDLKLNIRFEGRYWDNRWSNTSFPYSFYPSFIELPTAWIINATGFFNFGALKMFISLENILDKEYQLVYGYPMHGRTVHYGLRWEFWE